MKDIRLWGILILALAVRAVMLFPVFADVDRAKTPDSEDYELIANVLASKGQYSNSHHFPPQKLGSTNFEGPEIIRPPGYPALLAGAVRVSPPAVVHTEPVWAWRIGGGGRRTPMRTAKVGPPAQEPPAPFLKVVLSFQVLIDLHLVMLTFFLGRSLTGHRVGLLAALFQAISPLAAAASCRVLPDSIFAFLLTAGVLLLIRHFRTGEWWPLLSAGLVTAGASYFQPVGLAFSTLIVLVLLCQPKRVRRTVAFATVLAACVAPWFVRNANAADYRGFSSFAAEGVYWHCAAQLEASTQGVPAEDIQMRLIRAEGWMGPMKWYEEEDEMRFFPTRDANAPSNRTPGKLADYRWHKAGELIAAHLWQYPGIHLRGNMAFWLPETNDALEVMGYKLRPERTMDVLHLQGIIAAAKHYFGDNTKATILGCVMLAILAIRYLGVVLCGLWRFRPRMTAGGWLCLLLVLTAWLLPGPVNSPRFRVPVEPILSVGAAIGWLGLREWRRRRRMAGQ